MPHAIKKSKRVLIQELIADPDRKTILNIMSDILSLTLYHKSFPKHYFSRYLFKKGRTNIKDYFSNEFLYYKLKPFFNDHSAKDVVENKLFFDFYFGQLGITLPKLLLYNQKQIFVKENVAFRINSLAEFKNLLVTIFNQNPAYQSIFIKQTCESYGGDHVFRITPQQLATEGPLLADMYRIITKSGFLFQETIHQHPELNRLNPSCINTIRMDTFIDNEGQVNLMSAYLRMSTNNKHVDNISSGGCLVGINLLTGELRKEGYPGFSASGTVIYSCHPVTQTVFEGFAIPYFEEARRMVLRAAGLVPGLRLVGWDVAISETGPVLVEGNSDYNMNGNDLSEGGFLTNAIFKKMLAEANLLR
jgi:hypothetical protein